MESCFKPILLHQSIIQIVPLLLSLKSVHFKNEKRDTSFSHRASFRKRKKKKVGVTAEQQGHPVGALYQPQHLHHNRKGGGTALKRSPMTKHDRL